jgi:hypothetical protein
MIGICAKISIIMSIGKFFLVQLLIILCFESVFCQDLIVSFIDRTNSNNVKIELNQALQLEGLKLKNMNSDMKVVIPYYMKNNIKYPYFSFIDIRFKSYVINSIKSNTINGTPPDSIKYKISRIRKVVNIEPNIYASTFVTFNDLIEVECFIVMDENKLKVLWPSLSNINSKTSRLFFSIKDLTLKGRIENEILSRYQVEIIKNDDYNRTETKS